MAAKLTDRAGAAAAASTRRNRDPDYPLVGETLGLWGLAKGIGRGGMGEVYEAAYDYLHLLTLRCEPEERFRVRRELERLPREEQARLATEMLGTPLPVDARFAIKVCSARQGTSGHKRFLQEAELAQRLGDHPYIVSVHAIHAGGESDTRLPLDTGIHKDVAFMVMDLATRTYDHTRLTLSEAVHVVRCIATALDHAHKHGIVHRDLKPENILGTTHHPLLTDFGIAKEVDHSQGLTRTGQVIGTLDYMSPEQATDAKNVDLRSDVYSLGVVLYEFATSGHLPYIHLAEREACLAAIRSPRIEPKWPRENARDFPRSLERVILKAIAHDPRERYQGMSDFIHDLDKFARGEWISPFGRVAPLRYLRFHQARHPRVFWVVPSVLALVVLVYLGLAVGRLFDETRNNLRRKLDRLEVLVDEIEARRRPQLAAADRDNLVAVLADELERQGNRYPKAAARFTDLERRRARHRYLSADFLAADSADAEAQLRLAAGVADPETTSWSRSRSGLRITHATSLNLAPYGAGLVFVRCELRTRPGFRLEVEEQDRPRNERRRCGLRLVGGQLELYHQDQTEGEVVLHRQAARTGDLLVLALEVRSDGLRAWLPGHRLVLPGVIGLGGSAGAAVAIDMPERSLLQRLEVWPYAPR